ncbi:hypothetical protein ASE03_22080 [Kitasatospora sp. Root187]|uniref:ATP-binding protein n=1 Tax=Kitasatospora sp. Root187 TaxID=1736486 RepID=UPI00070E7F1A|nr:ATP-binding protein [Kitasatospora sp. Root187]KRB72543.1 hypothetical protein ASE03_22080 [Kitasatospora sp. Root187]
MAAVAASVPVLRRFARSTVRSWGLPASVDEATAMVVTELAANAVRHSGSPDVALLIGLGEHALTIQVKDQGQWRSASHSTVPSIDTAASGGHGLQLVNAYSTGCVLWFEETGTRAVARVPLSSATRPGSRRSGPRLRSAGSDGPASR